MTRTDTQKDQILAALKAGDRLTPLDALERFGCFRLGARIFDLKQEGHDIRREMVERGDATVAEYWLKKPEPPLIQGDLLAWGAA